MIKSVLRIDLLTVVEIGEALVLNSLLKADQVQAHVTARSSRVDIRLLFWNLELFIFV